LIKRPFPAARILNKMNTQELIDFLFPNSSELRGAKALCVSHIYPSTGVRLPLKALREKADQLGIKYLIVDGAQAFGMIDVSKGDDDIKHTDFYACPGHKWLNGPPSTGILYIKNSKIRPPEFYPILSQRMSKYINNSQAFPMAQALQVRGCSNTPGFSAMLAAIDFQNRIGGAELIERQIIGMSEQIKSFINSKSAKALVSPDTDPQLLSGLTVFFPFKWQQPEIIFSDKKTADLVVNGLMSRNIQIRSIGFYDSSGAAKKSYALRVSTAVFNTDAHIHQFKQALQDVLTSL
jgi:L-cysteine/cystine lyase